MASSVLGITGYMGSGKTTIANRLHDSFGVTIISVDDIRRSIGGSSKDGFKELWESIRDQVRAEIERLIHASKGHVILEWARLVDDGFLDLIDKVIVVHCDHAQLMERFVGGDLSASQVKKRLKNQMATNEIEDALCAQNIEYKTIDTTNNLTDSALNKLYNDITAKEYDTDTAFCLFRIPNNGGRVIWEITNSCNYGCRYCIFNSTSRKPDNELDTNEIYKAIDELKECGFTHIKITGGEPFIRSDIMDIIRYIKKAKFRIDISTNAAFITRDIAEELASLNLDMVHVSLDGHTQELQETIRGKRTYVPTIEGLKNLINKGIYIRIGCVIYQNNQYKLRDLVEFCHNMDCDEVIFSIMEPVGRMRGRAAMLCDRLPHDLQAEIKQIEKDYKNKIKVSGSFTDVIKDGCGTCPGGERFLSIDHKGQVSPCPWVTEYRPDYVAKKTLHDYNLKDILNDQENDSFRHLVSELSDSGLDRCPMYAVTDFIEAELINNLFEGGLEENLKQGGRYSETSPMYLFTTENIAGYMRVLNLKDKDVLTIGGSGDQMINAYTAGAKSVTNFDINRLARHIAKLKTALLKKLSLEEFKNFSRNFNYNVYQNIKEELPFSTRYFFDKAYKYFSNNGQALRYSPLFRKQQAVEQIVCNNPYLLDDETYKIAQTNCKNKTLAWSLQSVEEAAKAEDSKYDVILLSNVCDYAHHMYKGDYLKAFHDNVIKLMSQKLRPGGILMIGYVFDALDMNKSSVRSKINNKEARYNAFGDYEDGIYEEIEISSAWEINNKDIILIWKKEK